MAERPWRRDYWTADQPTHDAWAERVPKLMIDPFGTRAPRDNGRGGASVPLCLTATGQVRAAIGRLERHF